jgi:hypothetical protein
MQGKEEKPAIARPTKRGAHIWPPPAGRIQGKGVIVAPRKFSFPQQNRQNDQVPSAVEHHDPHSAWVTQ